MILAIDIGNTHTVFGVFDGDDIVHQWRKETGATYNFKVEHDISGIIIASVSPSCDNLLKAYCENEFNITPIFITHENAGIAIDLETPEQVGADRLVNAAAVIAHYQTPAIVIDFGTATTFDVIGADNTYLGGVIAPGIRLSLNALTDAAAKLDTVPVEKPPAAIGKNTQNAMQAGLFYGYKGVIEMCVAEISTELSEEPYVIATGGLGRLFYGETPIINAYKPDLTLQGLNVLYKKLT
jgi:type III pantothenate kinase